MINYPGPDVNVCRLLRIFLATLAGDMWPFFVSGYLGPNRVDAEGLAVHYFFLERHWRQLCGS